MVESMSQYLKREDVLGKLVIDAEANTVGTVKDIAFSPTGEFAFVVQKKDSEEEVTIPISKVRKIGEFILLKEETKAPVRPPTQPQIPPQARQPPYGAPTQAPPPSTVPGQAPPQAPAQAPPPGEALVCPVCGYPNPPGTKYCLRCGAPLPEKKKKKWPWERF